VGIELVAERCNVGRIVAFAWLPQVDCGERSRLGDNPVEVCFVRHILIEYKDLEVDPSPVHQARHFVDAESAGRT